MAGAFFGDAGVDGVFETLGGVEFLSGSRVGEGLDLLATW